MSETPTPGPVEGTRPPCLECHGTRSCPECRGTGSDLKGGRCLFCDGTRRCPYCEPDEKPDPSRNCLYNENDPQAAAWLRELARQEQIPDGTVLESDIRTVNADVLRGVRQVHLFAGIGGWPLALDIAGWPRDRPVWTGSCPCQPYSHAGKRLGNADPRNLWPEMFRLVGECRPGVVFGEQVASAVGHGWLDRVSADLEGEGYAVGAAVLGAHSVGAPHIRPRIYWVAHLPEHGRGQGYPDTRGGGQGIRSQGLGVRPANGCDPGGLADAWGDRRNEQRRDARVAGESTEIGRDEPLYRRDDGWMDDPVRHGLQALVASGPGQGGDAAGSGPSFWADHDLIPCRDGKSRRVEPGTFPLAHGVPARVGRLRGYGNAVVPQVAAIFVRAYLTRELAA